MSGYKVRRTAGFAFAPLPPVAEPLATQRPGAEVGVSESEALDIAVWLDENRGAPIQVLDEEDEPVRVSARAA